MRTVKAYIYSRVSSLQQVDAFGLDRQISTVLDFLENAKLPAELGYQLDPSNHEVLESDKGLSGYAGHNFTKGSLGRFKERGFAPIFPDTCYHLTHYWPAAADIPVASDNPAHYADAIRYNARTPLQGSLLPLTRLVWA